MQNNCKYIFNLVAGELCQGLWCAEGDRREGLWRRQGHRDEGLRLPTAGEGIHLWAEPGQPDPRDSGRTVCQHQAGGCTGLDRDLRGQIPAIRRGQGR